MAPLQLRKPTTQFAMAIVALLMLAASVVGFESLRSSASAESGHGQLTVGGTTYAFSPSTCTIADSDFLVAGHGEVDGEPFWLSASGLRVNLAVGQESETERPEDDDLWLVSVDEISWRSDETHIDASATMRDERDALAGSHRGSLSVECPSA